MRTRSITCLFLLATIALVGCSKQDNEKIKAMSQLEGGAQADAGLASDREAAQELERELTEFYDIYEANSGHFEGTLTEGPVTRFKFRISLFPSEPRYRGTRKRSQAEVQGHKDRLFMNAEITQWNPLLPGTGGGCRVQNLRPDPLDGTVKIIAADCPSAYYLVLNGPTINGMAHSAYPATFDVQAERLP